MSNTVRVAASASVAALAGLFALPLYIIAIGWLTLSLPTIARKPLAEVEQPYTVQNAPTNVPFVDPVARDEKKFEACGDQTELVRWRLFPRRSQPATNPQPSRDPWSSGNHSVVWSDNSYRPIPDPDCLSGTCKPQQPAPAASAAKPLPDPEKAFSEVKTGAVRCECCKKTMIGDDQATYWTDDNQPVTFLCSSCATNTTKAERERMAAAWLDRVAPKLSPSRKSQYVAAIQ